MSNKKLFLKKAEKTAFDTGHRKTIRFNMSKYDAAVTKGKKQFCDHEKAKQWASDLKDKVLNNLSHYLETFEKNFTANGGHVVWAENESQAISLITEILKKHQVELVVKSKSMTTEELDLNDHLEQAGIESVETDLGEFIVQQAGERPYHIVTPAMHKSKEDIADLFHDKFQTPADSSPEYLTEYVRDHLRELFVKAGAGITGSNFLVADPGGIALTENEGNALMTTAFPKVHIAIAGIEKMIPSAKDLAMIWPLLSTSGTGQKITAYSSLITGPRKKDEKDGPDEMYVILLDNGRTNMYKDPTAREALKCLRCGACLNACPVYKNIGGYTYDSVYGGPIGSVITPYLKGFKKYHHLSSASSLCGKCKEVCPVKIDIPSLLLYNRSLSAEKGYNGFMWNQGMKGFGIIAGSRAKLDFSGGSLKNFCSKSFAGKAWGPRRKPPVFSNMSFSRKWKKCRENTT